VASKPVVDEQLSVALLIESLMSIAGAGMVAVLLAWLAIYMFHPTTRIPPDELASE